MKKIWQYLVRHFREEFHLSYYLTVALFLAICIYLNYKFAFEDNILRSIQGFPKSGGYWLMYATGYYTVLVLHSLIRRQTDFWRKKAFWTKSLLGITLLSLDSSVPFLRPFVQTFFDADLYTWLYKVLINLLGVLHIIVPLTVYYYYRDRREGHWYGLQLNQFDAKPYFIMLCLMLPLLIAASFQDSFLRQYPMYRPGNAVDYLQWPEWILVGIYETCYALDFVTVEFFFRGFLVIGMMSLLGRSALLPMAALYCFLHFGKPPGEAISAIAGGYILGVIAYETKSIWGGIMVHVGIAWCMELLAYLQKHYVIF